MQDNVQRNRQTIPGAQNLQSFGDIFGFRNDQLTKSELVIFLRPTIVHCESFAHPLANKEFLCPYASVVTCPQAEMLGKIGYTLAASVITKDAKFIQAVTDFPEIDRLNIGPVSTMKISWDQPHEGNMFEFLWKRRSIERAW